MAQLKSQPSLSQHYPPDRAKDRTKPVQAGKIHFHRGLD